MSRGQVPRGEPHCFAKSLTPPGDSMSNKIYSIVKKSEREHWATLITRMIQLVPCYAALEVATTCYFY